MELAAAASITARCWEPDLSACVSENSTILTATSRLRQRPAYSMQRIADK
eukprot:CAMPEP_0202893762 /NCGR_PEP_ID=MMETSP1392-20130828/3281_1 /ASSEMBLY_ACC=CAM_ASM_000868 /TAXON_ID=225041 /ORGANISM="Chlamydomonas chlamydogama, Strain SAG 11-48b" /LENGTH=49 /DNA_ID=CAMNT_0049578211 /DNA_START=710 /DNA_END=859 /DNA_ORIENTATION=-